ncbi:helix-turn-helix domain-containing protein [Chitinophaga caseinilytica]|uniref:helix-turn-helix domain-containing protein n=1 Tax=Chitinophaga caseinilytica TaxID=2267521 RepID=UPI003CC5F7E7
MDSSFYEPLIPGAIATGITGKIIADARDAKGWSQTDFANASGVSRVLIGKYK